MSGFLLNPFWFSTPTVSYLFETLADTTVTGSAVTSVDITGLSIAKTDEILLVCTIINPDATLRDYSMYFNNNTTSTNYYNQNFVAAITSTSAARSNNAIFVTVPASRKSLSFSPIKINNSGYIIFQSDSGLSFGSSAPQLVEQYGTTTFSETSITQITITASSASAIGIGSRFQLYKIGSA